MVDSYVNYPKALGNELVRASWTWDLVHQLTLSTVILRWTYNV